MVGCIGGLGTGPLGAVRYNCITLSGSFQGWINKSSAPKIYLKKLTRKLTEILRQQHAKFHKSKSQ
jgi:hypothetical protein